MNVTVCATSAEKSNHRRRRSGGKCIVAEKGLFVTAIIGSSSSSFAPAAKRKGGNGGTQCSSGWSFRLSPILISPKRAIVRGAAHPSNPIRGTTLLLRIIIIGKNGLEIRIGGDVSIDAQVHIWLGVVAVRSLCNPIPLVDHLRPC